MSTYGVIKAPGVFFHNTPKIGNSVTSKINYISEGKFNICPENSEYFGYFTEKIFQALEGGTIPLYWAISFPEVGIINKNKYVFCDVNNSELLLRSIEHAVNNTSHYINGDVFSESAHIIIQSFYTTLIRNLQINL